MAGIKALIVPSLNVSYVCVKEVAATTSADFPTESRGTKIILCERITDHSQEYEDHTEIYYEPRPWRGGARTVINLPVVAVYEDDGDTYV